jgi:hypothetical protein
MRCAIRGAIQNEVCYPKWGVLSKMRFAIQNKVCYPDEVCSPQWGVLYMCYSGGWIQMRCAFSCTIQLGDVQDGVPCMCYPKWRNHPNWSDAAQIFFSYFHPQFSSSSLNWFLSRIFVCGLSTRFFMWSITVHMRSINVHMRSGERPCIHSDWILSLFIWGLSLFI